MNEVVFLKASQLLKGLQNRKASIVGEDTFRKYGILVPLVQVDGETHIIFEVRAKHLRSQPGDVCFPGGKIDPEDEHAEACALRETYEELGIDPTHVYDVIPLDYVVSEAGRIIYPYAGLVENIEQIKINKAEVAEYFTVPLQFFMTTEPKQYKIHLKVQPEEDFPYDLIYNGEDYNWNMRGVMETFYQYGDKVIWGLTAKILIHFLALLQSEKRDGGQC